MRDRVRRRRFLAAAAVLTGTVTAAVIGLVVITHHSCGADPVTTYRGRYVLLDGTSVTTKPYSSKLTITLSDDCG